MIIGPDDEGLSRVNEERGVRPLGLGITGGEQVGEQIDRRRIKAAKERETGGEESSSFSWGAAKMS